MKKNLLIVLVAILFLSSCTSVKNNPTSYEVNTRDSIMEGVDNISNDVDYEIVEPKDDYDTGYEWAEENDINDFDECQDEFGTTEAEDGCNDYVKDNYPRNDTFYGYECTEDCSGHEAGYGWAEENDIVDVGDCDGNSQSFIEGCEVYVEENY